MDFDERHRALVHRQDRERDVADVFSLDGVGVAGNRRDGRRALHARVAKAVDDVFRFDSRPHHDADFGQLRADLGELVGEGALCGVELRRTLQQSVALDVEASALLGATRKAAIALRKASFGDHGASSRRDEPGGGSSGGERTKKV